MSAVKGSKPTRMVVVPYRPYARLTLVVAVVVLVLLTGVSSYFIGKYRGTSEEAGLLAERDSLRQELAQKAAEAEELSQQVANLRLASEVDRASNEDVRNQVIELKEKIANLEQDIAFYRNLMAPNENQRGLTIGSVDVISTGIPRRYNFKVVVQQFAINHQVLNGSLNITIVGYDGEEARRIPLKDLSDQVDEEDIKLRFRYFQNIEGQLQLPEGFEPERIELVAKSTGQNGTTVEKKFGWLTQES